MLWVLAFHTDEASASISKTAPSTVTLVNNEAMMSQVALKDFPELKLPSTVEFLAPVAAPLTLFGDAVVTEGVAVVNAQDAVNQIPWGMGIKTEASFAADPAASMLNAQETRGEIMHLVTLQHNSPPNWVGPAIGEPTITACLSRRQKVTSSGGCRRGYKNIGSTCKAQCPLAFPVEYGAEYFSLNRKTFWRPLSISSSVLLMRLPVCMNTLSHPQHLQKRTLLQG